MIISCISASNIKHAKASSTSLKVCEMIREIINKVNGSFCIDIIPLVDYELTPCIGCGMCYNKNSCTRRDDFNYLYSKLIKSDALFIVSAHYAPIPSKLSMLLEKMEQLAFLPRFHNENIHSPLYHKPVGIIGHGGGPEEIINGYRGVVLDTIKNALSWPIEMKIIGANDNWPNGVVFPIKEVVKDKNKIFPIQKYDWQDIQRRIRPLVKNVLKSLQLE